MDTDEPSTSTSSEEPPDPTPTPRRSGRFQDDDRRFVSGVALLNLPRFEEDFLPPQRVHLNHCFNLTAAKIFKRGAKIESHVRVSKFRELPQVSFFDKEPLELSTLEKISYPLDLKLTPLKSVIEDLFPGKPYPVHDSRLGSDLFELSTTRDSFGARSFELNKIVLNTVNHTSQTSGRYILVYGAIPSKFESALKSILLRAKKEKYIFELGELELLVFTYWKLSSEDLLTVRQYDGKFKSTMDKLFEHCCSFAYSCSDVKSNIWPNYCKHKDKGEEGRRSVSADVLLLVKIHYDKIHQVIEPTSDAVRAWNQLFHEAKIYHHNTVSTLLKTYTVCANKEIPALKKRFADYLADLPTEDMCVADLRFRDINYVFKGYLYGNKATKDLKRLCRTIIGHFCRAFVTHVSSTGLTHASSEVVGSQVQCYFSATFPHFNIEACSMVKNPFYKVVDSINKFIAAELNENEKVKGVEISVAKSVGERLLTCSVALMFQSLSILRSKGVCKSLKEEPDGFITTVEQLLSAFMDNLALVGNIKSTTLLADEEYVPEEEEEDDNDESRNGSASESESSDSDDESNIADELYDLRDELQGDDGEDSWAQMYNILPYPLSTRSTVVPEATQQEEEAESENEESQVPDSSSSHEPELNYKFNRRQPRRQCVLCAKHSATQTLAISLEVEVACCINCIKNIEKRVNPQEVVGFVYSRAQLHLQSPLAFSDTNELITTHNNATAKRTYNVKDPEFGAPNRKRKHG